MRPCSALVIVLALGLTISATGQGNQLLITVPVVDKSAPGSPIQAAGSAEFTESVENGHASCSFQCEIQFSNVSQQPILLLVIREEIYCAHGNGVRRHIEYDHFFNPGPLVPKQAEVEPRERCSSGNKVGPAASTTHVPTAEATTMYVQFEDGTSFGHEKYALHALRIRRGALKVLRRLQEIHATRGEEEFVRALLSKPDPRQMSDASSVEDLFLEPVRTVQRELGTAEALRRIQQQLSNAEEKLASLDDKAGKRN